MILILLFLVSISWLVYSMFNYCPEPRGHNFGAHSDLCLNEGCNEEAGTWKYCDGKSHLRKQLEEGVR